MSTIKIMYTKSDGLYVISSDKIENTNLYKTPPIIDKIRTPLWFDDYIPWIIIKKMNKILNHRAYISYNFDRPNSLQEYFGNYIYFTNKEDAAATKLKWL